MSIDIKLILKERFDNNMKRHKGIKWPDVFKKIENNPEKLKVLIKMEETGGEPDVIAYEKRQTHFCLLIVL